MTKARLAPNLPQVCHGVRANSVALGKSLASAPGRGLRARSPCPIATTATNAWYGRRKRSPIR